MDIGRRAAEIVWDAERQIHDLAEEALRQRDYGNLQRLSAIARCIAAASESAHATPTAPANGERKVAPPNSPSAQRSAVATELSTNSRFPRFFKDSNGNSLIKIGYSKSDRRTYEHRSPRDVLVRVIEVISDIGANGKRFTTDEILSAGKKQLVDVPTYQVYLCLAYLLQHNFLRRIGRLGYVIHDDVASNLLASIDAAWNSLPER